MAKTLDRSGPVGLRAIERQREGENYCNYLLAWFMQYWFYWQPPALFNIDINYMIFIIIDWSGWTIEHVTFSLGNGKRQGTIIYNQQFNYIYPSWSVPYLTQGYPRYLPCKAMCNLLYSFPYNRCTACAGGSPWAHLEGWQSCKERTSRGSEGALHEPLPGAQGKGGGWWRRDVLKKESAWNGFCYVLLIDMWTILSFDGLCCLNPRQLW